MSAVQHHLENCIIKAILVDECRKNRNYHHICDALLTRDINLIISNEVKYYIIRGIINGKIQAMPKYLKKICKIKENFTWHDIVHSFRRKYTNLSSRISGASNSLQQFGTNSNTNLPPLIIEQLPGFPIRYILTFLNQDDLEVLRTTSKRYKELADNPMSRTELLIMDKNSKYMPYANELGLEIDPDSVDIWEGYFNLKDLYIDEYSNTINEEFYIRTLPKNLELLEIKNTDIPIYLDKIPNSLKDMWIESSYIKNFNVSDSLLKRINIYNDNEFFDDKQGDYDDENKPFNRRMPITLKSLSSNFVPSNFQSLSNLERVIFYFLNDHTTYSERDLPRSFPKNLKKIGYEFDFMLASDRLNLPRNLETLILNSDSQNDININILNSLPQTIKKLHLSNLDIESRQRTQLDLSQYRELTDIAFSNIKFGRGITLKVNKVQLPQVTRSPQIFMD